MLSSFAVLLLLPSITRADDLESRIAPLAKAHKGKVAVAVKHLKTGEEYYFQADEPMPTASLIKLPVMVETYWQANEGKVSLNKTLTLAKEDKVPGSGILTLHFSDGATFPLRDSVRLMIAHSDKDAATLARSVVTSVCAHIVQHLLDDRDHSASTTMAIPMPPPMHRAATP